MRYKRHFLRVLLLFACTLFTACVTQGDDKAVHKPINKVLFVGNSLSYFNNGLHNHVGNLLRASN